MAGEATAEELEELDALLAQHPELQYAFSMLKEMSPLPKADDPPTDDELMRKQRGALRLQQMLDDEAQPAQVKRLQPKHFKWMAAASIMLMVAATAIWVISTRRQQPTQIVMETDMGDGQRELVLPDGSKVILNAGSRLEYNEAGLANGKREVKLEGEGFFTVKADVQHPFVIKTGKVDVMVLGTTFNLKAYPKDNRVETFLISGKVEVAYEENGKKTRRQLNPSQRFIVSLPAVEISSHQQVTPPPILKTATPEDLQAAAMEPGWLNGRLEFENVTFGQLINELERWYGVSIVLKNQQLKTEVFTGAFEDKSLPEVLQALQYTLQFKYSIHEESKTVELW